VRAFKIVMSVLLVVTIGMVGLAYAAVQTGIYNGTVAQQRVGSGLNTLKVLRITAVVNHGKGQEAYTTDSLLALCGSPAGCFLSDGKLETGISFDGANFLVTNPDFIQQGVPYSWEALGD